MVNRKQIAKKFILLSVLILFSAGLYIYARVFAKALDSGLALTYPVAMRILGRSAASLLGMVISMLMYGIMLRKDKNHIVFLLLFGLILSSIVQSFTNYIEVLLDPQQFQQLKAATTVSVTNMNEPIIILATPAMMLLTGLFVSWSREFDVMLLGENHAKSLGIPYTRRVNSTLLLIAFGMAVTTALIGPLTFLGLLAVNIARERFKTYRHSILFFGSILMAVLFLVLGQGIVELTRYAVPVTVLIDLAGGAYMIILIMKEHKL